MRRSPLLLFLLPILSCASTPQQASPPAQQASSPPQQQASSPPQQQAAPPDNTAVVLTPEHAVKYRRISDLHFSPDGSAAIFVVSEVNGPGIESHVWMADIGQENLRQFTSSHKSERSPQWAPRGTSLAFLSNRTGTSQVYVMPRSGREARSVTTGGSDVTNFRWSPDGSQIAYLARAPEPASVRDDNAPRVADREQDLGRLWVVDLASGKVRQLTGGTWRVDEFDWLNSDKLLAVASENAKSETWNDALYEIALRDARTTLVSKPNQPFGGLLVSPAGSRFSFESTRAGGPIPHDLYIQNIVGGPAVDVTAGVDRAVLGAKWQNEGTLWARIADGFRNRLIRIDAHGVTTGIELPYSARDFDVARDGTLIFAGVGFDRLPELFVRRPNGTVTQIGRLQEGWDGIRLVDAEIFKFKSFDGMPIEAALMQPAAGNPKDKLPLILLVHGGPSSNFSADYFWFNAWSQLLVTRGYQVLMVNPRGSIGYGEEFIKANHADLGGGDYRDIMAALDAVMARGQTDPTRLGIGGWSYGAEMTQWAIGHTDRFKAAVSGGGVFDQAAEFGTEDDSAGDEWQFGTPWTDPEVFARNSPMTFIRNAKTPTLIVHGEDDHNNPIGQSQALYRALKRLGVESEFITYPGEGHLPRQENHQIDIMQRMLDWYDRHLN